MNDLPIEWRVFVYRGRILYKCSKFVASSDIVLPEPPKEILDSIATDEFRAFDLALTSDGSWKILNVKRGEQARVPHGGSVIDFYNALEYGLTHEPKTPDWVWCPVGRIRESHFIGEDHVRVSGSKDFAAGTKVYMVNAFWGDGGERCLVLGVPKYSNNIIGTIIKTSLIVGWELERVTDKAVLRAMFTNRLSEVFERPRETELYGCWGQSDEAKKSILGFVDYNNQEEANRKR